MGDEEPEGRCDSLHKDKHRVAVGGRGRRKEKGEGEDRQKLLSRQETPGTQSQCTSQEGGEGHSNIIPLPHTTHASAGNRQGDTQFQVSLLLVEPPPNMRAPSHVALAVCGLLLCLAGASAQRGSTVLAPGYEFNYNVHDGVRGP